jgi:hypothetical protein
MATSLLALEQAARAGDVLDAIEVLLDELESFGALGSGDHIGRVRQQLRELALARRSIWAQQPEVTLIDLYARTLELAELDVARSRWTAELDARGPWLRALRLWNLDADDGLPLSFSPDGTRIVADTALLDGRTGMKLAQLDVRLGNYLEGGPAWPWHHVGTEFIVCIHGGLALWETRTGEPVTPGERMHMHVPLWECIAYSRSGRSFARGRGHRVVIGALPSTATVAELEFAITIERIALSATGKFVAAYGAGRIEVRDCEGNLICTGQTSEPREPEPFLPRDGSFAFVADDRQLLLHELASSGWSSDRGNWETPSTTCVWDLDTNPATLVGSEIEPEPPGWTIEDGPISIFTHTSGARILVPSAGPWVASPVDCRLLACSDCLFELREGSLRAGR